MHPRESEILWEGFRSATWGRKLNTIFLNFPYTRAIPEAKRDETLKFWEWSTWWIFGGKFSVDFRQGNWALNLSPKTSRRSSLQEKKLVNQNSLWEFHFLNSSGAPGKFFFPGVQGTYRSFLPPTPSRGRPPPHRKMSGPKSLSLWSFFLPERREMPFAAREGEAFTEWTFW